jgi:DNA-nicking Smr family endonuclease
MAGRRLSPEEQARWAELVRTVKPLRRPRLPEVNTVELPAKTQPKTVVASAVPPQPLFAAPNPVRSPRPVPVLDSTWEKAIRAGRLVPDHSIDLHGHDLSAAHLRLDRALAQAVQMQHRVLLVVTGKPRGPEQQQGGKRRGAIRAEIGHWITHSPHAGRVASVRVAHPRHGGSGALYIILRRSAAS